MSSDPTARGDLNIELKALRVSEVDYVKAILNTVPAAILVLDREMRIKTSNEAFHRLFRVSKAQTEDQSFFEIGGGHWNTPTLNERLSAVLESGVNLKDFEITASFSPPDRRTMVLNAQRLEQEVGAQPLILLSIIDVTERRQIEGANQWMGAIVESSEDAIISKDLNGIIKSCNVGATRLFGYEVSELIRKPMTMLIPLDHQQEEAEILARIRSGKRIEHFETIRQRKDGSLIAVSLVVSPVKDVTGKIIGASKIARDITDRKRSEQKLAESFHREKLAREQAEKANRAKDDFLASLSHELRTPLNPVLLLASDYSENEDLSPEIRNHFETIRKNIELEARLIDDLLDLTRITHGKLSLHSRVIDIKDVLKESIAAVRSEIDEKRIRLRLDLNSSHKHVFGDDVRLHQVFWNILKNAAKFTPVNGEIAIRMIDSKEGLEITIADTGIGLKAEEIARIFSAFSQGDHSKTDSHRFGGLGLGLTISRKLVEMHNGRISAESEGPNLGSRFIIQLPVAVQESIPTAPAVPLKRRAAVVPEKRFEVLLVEDHEPTRAAMTHLLTRRGYVVAGASNAKEARNLGAKQKFDVVISDIGLPDENGNQLMSHLQKEYGLTGIALTGYGMEEDVAKCLASGFVTHLIKPVNIKALENALESILGRKD